jgi:hypothetical protein
MYWSSGAPSPSAPLDAKYRRLYLRPFDRKWGNNSLRLEEFLQSRLDEHSKK